MEIRFAGNQGDTTTVATNAKYQYVWDVRYIDAAVCRDEDKSDPADGDCMDEGDQHLYYCQDANFNVTALVDGSDGSVVERYVYDPYGKVSFYDGSWTSRGSSAYHNAILFCGYRYDDETGLYHVRHRTYHPALGRWAQRDAVGYADGISVYEYARSSPIVRREAVQKLQQQSAQLRRAGIPERPPTDPAARVGGNRPVPPSPGGGRFPREREPADELSL